MEEPILAIDENTTDNMIKKMSNSMARHVLSTYATENNITFPPDFFSSFTDHNKLLHECRLLRDNMRASKNLPPLPQPDPDIYKKTAENLNGNHLSRFLPKSTKFVDPRAPTPNNGTLANRFDQNDFYVRVTVPMKANNVHIPMAVKQAFVTFRRSDPSFCLMPFDRSNTSKNDIITKESSIPNTKKRSS